MAKFKTRTLERFLNAEEFQRLGTALGEPSGGRQPALRGRGPAAGAHRLPQERGRPAAVVRGRSRRCLLRLRDSKSGAKILPLSPEAVALLAGLAREQASPWVFPAARGDGPIVGLPKFFGGLCRRAGLEDVTLHTLRHSLASTAAASGASLYLVGKALGHANVATTQRYAHVLDPVAQVVADAAGRIDRAMRSGSGGTTSPSADVLHLRR